MFFFHLLSGKTYVGLKIAQALLTNKELWNDPINVRYMDDDDLDDDDLELDLNVGGEAPMLVVCYTNHALDQFLEGKLWKLHQIYLHS